MWFRQAEISQIASDGNTVRVQSVELELNVESVPETPIVRFVTLEEASRVGGEAGAAVERLTGSGGNSITTAAGYRIHSFTSVGTQQFTIG